MHEGVVLHEEVRGCEGAGEGKWVREVARRERVGEPVRVVAQEVGGRASERAEC